MKRFPDARTLCPDAGARRIHTLLPFKLALVQQYGVDDGFRIYREMLGLPNSYHLELRTIRPLGDFSAASGASFTELYPSGEPFRLSPPAVVSPGDQRPMVGVSRSYFVACLTDARVQPHSALVEANGETLLDYEGEELTRFDDNLELDPCIFHAAGSDAWIICDDRDSIEVEEAFGSLIGPRSHHFGHWLWEYLPKYATAVELGAIPPVPVLINAGIGDTLRDALTSLLPQGVRLVEVPSTPFASIAPARVRRLWLAPCLFHEPFFEEVNERYPGPDHRCFPPDRFRPTLARMGRAAEATSRTGHSDKRVYLARKPQLKRKLVNYSEIEALVASRGFTIIYPEEHSFAEQIRYVRDADFVLGPEGSAMYLNFYARPGTRLCILNPPYTLGLLASTPLMKEAGVEVTIFTGTATESLKVEHGFFAFPQYCDYRIETEALENFLDDWLGADERS